MATALYIHIPFCKHICPYCDFFKTQHSKEGETAMIRAMCIELDYYADKITDIEHPIHSVYFGGGTPTCLSPSSISTLMTHIRTCFTLLPHAEISIECNPETLTPTLLQILTKNGVNRISLGVQSFNNNDLRFLGRGHDTTTIDTALNTIRNATIKNVNIDLMFSLKNQTQTDINHQIDMAIACNATHISSYALSIEPGTPFHKKGITPLPNDTEYEHYTQIIQKLTAAGYEHYEVSAFAKSGYECQHNLSYWKLTPYIGIGPSAHSYIANQHYNAPRNIDRYIATPTAHIPDITKQQENSNERLSDAICTHLRLIKEGLDIDAINTRFNIDFRSLFNSSLTTLTREALITKSPSHIHLTPKGLALLDTVLLEFMHDV